MLADRLFSFLSAPSLPSEKRDCPVEICNARLSWHPDILVGPASKRKPKAGLSVDCCMPQALEEEVLAHAFLVFAQACWCLIVGESFVGLLANPSSGECQLGPECWPAPPYNTALFGRS
jgi:hypothetical protein